MTRITAYLRFSLCMLLAGCDLRPEPREIIGSPWQQKGPREITTDWSKILKPPADTPCRVEVKSPAVMSLIRSTRPPGLDSLEFYQSLSRYDSDDQLKLVDRYLFAKDCPPDIEVSPLPTRIAERRKNECRTYFGYANELTAYWTLQHTRSAYEAGLVTRTEARRKMLDLGEQVRGIPLEFRDYLTIRTDQWTLDDRREAFPYSTGLHSSPSEFWSEKSLLAFADALRFLDRHGLCCLARFSSTAFRIRLSGDEHAALAVSWLVEYYFHMHDQDWSLALAAIDQAAKISMGFEAKLLSSLGLNQKRRVSYLKNSLPVSEPASDATNLIDLLTVLMPSKRAELLCFLCDNQGQLSAAHLHAFSIFLNPLIASRLSKNESLVKALIVAAENKDPDDWYALLAIQNLTRLFRLSMSDELQRRIVNCWTSTSLPCLNRYRRISSCTGHDQLQVLCQTLARTTIFRTTLIDPDDKASLTGIYKDHCDLREMDARVLRRSLKSARSTDQGRSHIHRVAQLNFLLSDYFWDSSERLDVAEVDALLATLIVLSNRGESEFLQLHGFEIPRSSSVDWMNNLDRECVVVNFTQWIDLSLGKPRDKLAAFIVTRATQEKTSIRLLKLDVPIQRMATFRSGSDIARRIEVIVESHPDSSDSITETLSAILSPNHSAMRRIVVIPDSSTGSFPWTSFLVNEVHRATWEVESINLCFHPCQISHGEGRKEMVDDIHFLSNENYGNFRNSHTAFPYDVPDLKGVGREEDLIRQQADRFSIKWNASRSGFPRRNFSSNSIVHFAGHAANLDLQQLASPAAMRSPHLRKLAREISAWYRVPFVASTLVLSADSSTMSSAESKGFLSANAIRYLPCDPPSVVVLSTCNSVGGHSLPTKAPAGLAKAFWIWGADFIIASPDMVPDNNPSQFLPDFYHRALAGDRFSNSFYAAYRSTLIAKPTEAPSTNWNFYGY